MKTGIFGGTFDPVHLAHIELAKYAMQRCQLAEIIFFPTVAPPHKKGTQITALDHRVEMLKIAIAKEKNFSISTLEKQLPEPSYTIDALRLFFKTSQNTPDDYSFIIGVDAFLDIASWKESAEVLRAIHFIVAARKGYEYRQFEDFTEELRYQKKKMYWSHPDHAKTLFYLEREIQGSSSSAIRQSLYTNNPLSSHLDPTVLKYIYTHALYHAANL